MQHVTTAAVKVTMATGIVIVILAVSTAFVTFMQDGSLSLLPRTVKADSVIGAIPVGNGPMGIAYDSANGNVYVANFYSNTISVVDGNTNNVIDTIPLYYGGAINPSGIVYNPADNHLYVTNYYNTGNSGVTIGGSATTTIGGIVSVIDGNTNNVIANMVVGNAPQDVAFNSANGQAYVTNFLSNSVSVISSSSIVNPVQSIQALIQSIQSTTTISQGIQLSLISTLNTALSILSTGAPGSYIAACNQLNVFNNQVYGGVQYGLIDQITGLQLVQSSQAIQQALGC